MAHLFGNVNCNYCGLNSRFLSEEVPGEEKLLLIGEHSKIEFEKQLCECDYCQNMIEIHTIIKNDILSAFLNEDEYKDYLENKLTVKEAKENEGYEEEKRKNLTQFHETFTINFNKQPYKLEQTLNLNDEKWVVKSIYKKESIEKDVSKRILSPFYNEYIYKLNHKNSSEEKWLVVTDVKGDNAIMVPENPFVKENEQVIDVSETGFKDIFLFEKKVGENYQLKAFQQLSGVRLLVYTIDEKESKHLEADIYGESLENALEQLEEIFAQEEV